MCARRLFLVPIVAVGFSLASCGGSGDTGDSGEAPAATTQSGHGHDHDHGDGSDHTHGSDGGHEPSADDAHAEESLGTTTIGDMTVVCWQGHGVLAAGKESHLVVQLPHDDKGATEVRAWIGGEDRMQSIVSKGAFNASHKDYDMHAMAPDPLPARVMWWIEVSKPDGTKAVGSIAPLR